MYAEADRLVVMVITNGHRGRWRHADLSSDGGCVMETVILVVVLFGTTVCCCCAEQLDISLVACNVPV